MPFKSREESTPSLERPGSVAPAHVAAAGAGRSAPANQALERAGMSRREEYDRACAGRSARGVRRLLPEGVQMADETFRLKVMLEKGEVHIQPIVRGSEIWPRSVLG